MSGGSTALKNMAREHRRRRLEPQVSCSTTTRSSCLACKSTMLRLVGRYDSNFTAQHTTAAHATGIQQDVSVKYNV